MMYDVAVVVGRLDMSAPLSNDVGQMALSTPSTRPAETET